MSTVYDRDIQGIVLRTLESKWILRNIPSEYPSPFFVCATHIQINKRLNILVKQKIINGSRIMGGIQRISQFKTAKDSESREVQIGDVLIWEETGLEHK